MRHQFFKPRSMLPFLVFLLALVVTSSARRAQLPPDNPLTQLTSHGHVLGFRAGGFLVSNATYSMRVEFVEANAVAPQSDSAARPHDTGTPPLSRVTYVNLWDGITLAYDDANGGVVSSTYRLEPNADPGAIHLRYNAPIVLNEDGTLRIAYATGEMVESAPRAWQEGAGGEQVRVAVAFAGAPKREVAFAVGEYDASQPLFIDPTLTWNTFLGGNDGDIGYGIAVDGSGSVYVTGSSAETWGKPVRAYSDSYNDAFAAKLDSSGDLIWNTFLGGSEDDFGYAIAVGGGGNVYVAGRSDATWGSPVRAYTEGTDAFAAKLDPSGNLIWNTFLGGNHEDHAYAIAIDGSANVYVAGLSYATWGKPVRPYTGSDAFAAKLNPSGELTWNTFLGGTDRDHAYAIAIDGSANVYVAGLSYTTWGKPVRAYTYGMDAFAAKLDASGELTWNTFLGGDIPDIGYGIAIDGSGNVYVAGESYLTWGSPVRAHTENSDAFAAKLDASGELTWNTFLGGTGWDNGRGIAVDGSGNVYVAGESNALWGSPVRDYTNNTDALAAKLDSSGNLLWHAFLGGTVRDAGYAIAVDASGNAYVTGGSEATWGSPVRPYTSYDAFAAKINNSPTAPIPFSPTDNEIIRRIKFKFEWNCLPCGSDYKLKIKDTTLGKTFLSQSGIKETQIKVTGLTRGHSYSWRLKACNPAGCTKGLKFHFTVKSATLKGR